MTKDEALHLALKLLEFADECGHVVVFDPIALAETIAAIKEALATTSTTCDVQPEQEPVAKKHEPTINLDKYAGTYGGYTTQPASVNEAPQRKPQEFVCSTGLCHYRKPLTDEEIKDKAEEAAFMVYEGRNYILSPSSDTDYDLSGELKRFARAIEAAHGIKE